MNHIEKNIELKAPLSKVWRALTDHHEFGNWFQVKVKEPFAPHKTSHGKLTYPGFENYPWEITVQEIVPESLFSFTWHPFAIDPKRDYSKEPQTLIEFRLKPTSSGTLLSLKESGFDKIPADRRSEAFQMNSEGWTEQMTNIEKYVSRKGTSGA
jgi:uncharacterized protein YndB with AHSA1/START domain